MNIPLLWLPAAVIVVRWSRFAAWALIAGSFSVGAGGALQAAWEIESAFVAGPPPFEHVTTLSSWWTVMVVAWVLLAAATAAGWQAFAATRPAFPGPRLRASAVVAMALFPVAAVLVSGSELSVFVAQEYPGLWVVPYGWRHFYWEVPIACGLGVIAWRRLIPAVAEAELVAGNPFAPLRYVWVLGSEFVTGQVRARSFAAEAERARLASDLHAEVLPSITQLLADNAAGAPTEVVAERLRAVESEVRGLLAERRLVILEEFGIVEALEWLVGRAEERLAFSIELTVDARTTDERPPRAVERAAFRIAQLAVENAIQHANPSSLSLDVIARRNELRIAVADDGSGTSAEAADASARANRHGLADMRFQADQVRGRLDVAPAPTGGTSVTFAWTAP